jgi:hypothetical protein
MDGWMDGWMDGMMDGWTKGADDRCLNHNAPELLVQYDAVPPYHPRLLQRVLHLEPCVSSCRRHGGWIDYAGKQTTATTPLCCSTSASPRLRTPTGLPRFPPPKTHWHALTRGVDDDVHLVRVPLLIHNHAPTGPLPPLRRHLRPAPLIHRGVVAVAHVPIGRWGRWRAGVGVLLLSATAAAAVAAAAGRRALCCWLGWGWHGVGVYGGVSKVRWVVVVSCVRSDRREAIDRVQSINQSIHQSIRRKNAHAPEGCHPSGLISLTPAVTTVQLGRWRAG